MTNCNRCKKSVSSWMVLNGEDVCSFCITPAEDKEITEARRKAQDTPRMRQIIAERMGITVKELMRLRRQQLDHYTGVLND